MAKQMAGEGPAETPEQILLGTTQPLPALARAPIASRPLSAGAARRSYHPTGWGFADRTLDVVDNLTGGKADWFQRLFSYLFIGGCAALVNLLGMYIFFYRVPLAADKNVHYIVADVIATEISIIANFIPNDRITFSRLPGHQRSWLARCVRFHLTAIVGTVITIVLSFALYTVFGLPGLIPQAIAIIIALGFNFTFHHLFTYRHP